MMTDILARQSGPVPTQSCVRSPQQRFVEEPLNACADEVRREGSVDRRQWNVAGVLDSQQNQAEPFVHPALVGQAPAQVASEDQASTGLAPSDRLTLPHLHA